jgi:hypothetical protein
MVWAWAGKASKVKEESKKFFFEKKNQKTFVNLDRGGETNCGSFTRSFFASPDGATVFAKKVDSCLLTLSPMDFDASTSLRALAKQSIFLATGTEDGLLRSARNDADASKPMLLCPTCDISLLTFQTKPRLRRNFS